MSITPILLRRHAQLQKRPDELRTSMRRIASLTWHPGNYELRFPRRLAPFGKPVMIVLSRHLVGDASAECHFLRGYTADFNHRTGRVYWGTSGSVFAYDICHRPVRGAAGKVLDVNKKPQLGRTAMDLDRHACKAVPSAFKLPGKPLLPPTILAFSPGTSFRPVDTPFVISHAESRGVSTKEAWHTLFERLRLADPCGSRSMIDLRLINVHKLPDGDLLQLYHDFGPLLDRDVYNPMFRWRPLQAENPAHIVAHSVGITPGQGGEHDDRTMSADLADVIIRLMRSALGHQHIMFADDDLAFAFDHPDHPVSSSLSPKELVEISKEVLPHLRQTADLADPVYAAATAADWINAAKHPEEPMRLSRVARLQSWQLVDGAPEEIFRFRTHTTDVDLGQTRKKWFRSIFSRNPQKRRVRAAAHAK